VTDPTQLAELVEAALRGALALPHPALEQFYGMMQYHLGCAALLRETGASA